MIDKFKGPRWSPVLFCVLIAVGFVLCEPGIALAQVTGSGTTGKIPKWSGTTTLTDSVMGESSGNVGIGTTTPSNKLDIFGTAASQLHLTSNASTDGLYLFANGSDAYYLGGTTFDGANWIAKAANASIFAQAGGSSMFYGNTNLSLNSAFPPTERMRLTSNGLLGIGTSTPGRLLHLRDTATQVFTGARVSVSVDGSDPVYELLHETANKGFRWRLGNGGVSDLYLDFTSNGFTSYTPYITVLNTGNVGIGTISPGYKLHVNGGREWISPTAESFALGISRTDISGAFWIGASNSTFTPDLILSNNSGTERVRVTDTGRVGIGTNAPSTSLHVVGTATVTGAVSTGTLNATGAVSTGPLTVSGAISTGTLTATGNVSTGPLTVSGAISTGTLNATGAVSTGALTVTGNIAASGNITATGNIAAKYQDVAEWVPASRAIAAGTVVVLDVGQSNHVLPSNHSYDTRVAGVVSSNPGVILGEAGQGKVMVATTGRVRIKVDASNGPIRVGDLLVTSDKEGIAMKSQPLDLAGTPIHRPGTLIGKALEPLEKGVGEILALLSLQ